MAKAKEKGIVRKDLDEAIEELAVMTDRAIEKSVEPLREDIEELKQGQVRLENGVQSILKVVQGIDEQLREHRTHPDRIARLERSVFQ